MPIKMQKRRKPSINFRVESGTWSERQKRWRWSRECETTRVGMIRDNKEDLEVTSWVRRAKVGARETFGGGAAAYYRLTAFRGRIRVPCR